MSELLRNQFKVDPEEDSSELDMNQILKNADEDYLWSMFNVYENPNLTLKEKRENQRKLDETSEKILGYKLTEHRGIFYPRLPREVELKKEYSVIKRIELGDGFRYFTALPDGTAFCGYTGGGIDVIKDFNDLNSEENQSLHCHEDEIMEISFFPDRSFVTASRDGCVKIFKLSNDGKYAEDDSIEFPESSNVSAVKTRDDGSFYTMTSDGRFAEFVKDSSGKFQKTERESILIAGTYEWLETSPAGESFAMSTWNTQFVKIDDPFSIQGRIGESINFSSLTQPRRFRLDQNGRIMLSHIETGDYRAISIFQFTGDTNEPTFLDRYETGFKKIHDIQIINDRYLIYSGFNAKNTNGIEIRDTGSSDMSTNVKYLFQNEKPVRFTAFQFLESGECLVKAETELLVLGENE